MFIFGFRKQEPGGHGNGITNTRPQESNSIFLSGEVIVCFLKTADFALGSWLSKMTSFPRSSD
jgi:hypothetical protein